MSAQYSICSGCGALLAPEEYHKQWCPALVAGTMIAPGDSYLRLLDRARKAEADVARLRAFVAKLREMADDEVWQERAGDYEFGRQHACHEIRSLLDELDAASPQEPTP